MFIKFVFSLQYLNLNVAFKVIAPVRETCAQCLGVAASLLGSKGIIHIATSLKILANQSHWEARHGALLGFKYLLVVQQVNF